MSNPTIVSATLTHSFIDIVLSEACYTNTGASGALTTGDFALTYIDNGDTGCTSATLTSVTKLTNAALTGGETNIRCHILVDGPATGLASVEIKPASGSSIYNATDEAMSDTQTTGVKVLNPFYHLYWDPISGNDANSGLTAALPRATYTSIITLMVNGENKIVYSKAYYRGLIGGANTSLKYLTIEGDSDGTVWGNNRTQTLNFDYSAQFGFINGYLSNVATLTSTRNFIYDSVNGYYYFCQFNFGITISNKTNGVFRSKDCIVWENMKLPPILLDSIGSLAQSSSSMSLVSDSNGNITAFITSNNSSKSSNTNLMCIKWTYSNSTWGSWVNITDLAYDQSGVYATINTSNKFYVVFEGKSATYTTKQQIYFTSSSDGTTWSTPVIVNSSPSTSYEQITPKIGIGTNGKLHVVWQAKDATYTNRVIKYSSSTDDGATWSSSVITEDSPSNSWYSQQPELYVSGDNIYLAYVGYTTGQTAKLQIKFQKSTNNGVTWENKVIIREDTNTKSNPQLIVDSSGYIWIIMSVTTTAYWTKSTDAGVNWDAWTSYGGSTAGSKNINICYGQPTFTKPIFTMYTSGQIIVGTWTTTTMNSPILQPSSATSTSLYLREIKGCNIIAPVVISGGQQCDLKFKDCYINGYQIWSNTTGNSTAGNNEILGETKYTLDNTTFFQSSGDTGGFTIININNNTSQNINFVLNNSTIICNQIGILENAFYTYGVKLNFLNSTIHTYLSSSGGLFFSNGTDQFNLWGRQNKKLYIDTCTINANGFRHFNFVSTSTSNAILITPQFYRPYMKDLNINLNGVALGQQYIDNYANLSTNVLMFVDVNYANDFNIDDSKTMSQWFDIINDSRSFVNNINGDTNTHIYWYTGAHEMDNKSTYSGADVFRMYHSIGTHDKNGRPEPIRGCISGTQKTINFNFNHHVNANATYYIKLHVWKGTSRFSQKFATVSYLYDSKTIDTWYAGTLAFTPDSTEDYYYMLEVSRQYDATHNYTLITQPTIS